MVEDRVKALGWSLYLAVLWSKEAAFYSFLFFSLLSLSTLIFLLLFSGADNWVGLSNIPSRLSYGAYAFLLQHR